MNIPQQPIGDTEAALFSAMHELFRLAIVRFDQNDRQGCGALLELHRVALDKYLASRPK